MKRKEKNATSQLLIHDSMSMSVKHKKIPGFFMVLHPLISLCGILSVIYCMYGFFDFPLDLKIMTLTSIAAIFIMFLVRSVSRKAGFAAVILVLLTVPVLLIFYRDDASLGAQNIYDLMHAKIFHEAWMPNGEFVTGGQIVKWSPALALRGIQLLCDIVLVILIALMEYTDVLLTQGNSGKIAVAIRFLMTFPFLESGLYFGLETSSFAVFLMIVFWISSIAMVRPKLLKQTGNIQKTTDKLQRDFLYSSDKHFMPHEMAALMLVTLAGFGAFAASKGCASYTRTDSINEKRTEIINMYRNFSIRDATGLLSKIPTAFGINVISDELDLTRRGSLDFDGRTVLKMDIGGRAAIGDYYMRGTVRSEYTGKGWAIPTSVYRENMDLFQDLTDLTRMPQTMFHSDYVESFQTPNGKYEVVRCNVHALNSEQVNYLPYQYVHEPGTKYRYDTEVELGNHQEYSFLLLKRTDDRFVDVRYESLSKILSYVSNERVLDYQKFVKDTYLDVPQNDAMRRIAADFNATADFSSASTEATFQTTTNPAWNTLTTLYAIRNYIWDHAEYTTSPGMTPENEDFAEYFLLKNHKGYCAHYASAAVLLCRMAGIPARYVHGYVLTEGNFIDAYNRNAWAGNEMDDYHIEIADNQAHAWVEIYIDNYGWMPVEFTESVVSQWHQPTVAPVTTKAAATAVSGQAGSNALTTTTTTTTATVTTTNNAVGGGNDPANPDGGRGYVIMKQVLQVMLALLIVASIVFGWYAWHRAVTEKRKREMNGRNPNRSAEASYRFCIRLLEMLGIRQRGLSHEAFAIAAEADCRLLESGRLSDTIHMMQTVAFSRDGIAKEEAAQIADTAFTLADHIYQNANPFKRFWMKWFLHIV